MSAREEIRIAAREHGWAITNGYTGVMHLERGNASIKIQYTNSEAVRAAVIVRGGRTRVPERAKRQEILLELTG